MKLFLKNSIAFSNERFNARCIEEPCLEASWHYHPEFELLYVSKSNGIRFVGNSVAHFSAGDLVLVGPYVPHLWRNDVSYYQEGSEDEVQTVVVKFTSDFIGQETFDTPEFSGIKNMLELSKYGISFEKKTGEKLHKEMMEIIDSPAPLQLIKLLNLLYNLSLEESKEVLSSTDTRQYNNEPMQRLDMVLKFISDNYSKNIRLQDVADIACMTTNSFCRFFKKMINKSFTQFLNEVRIRNASRLLLQRDLTVTDVCYMVGYNSMTNFYKQFKQIMGHTPNSYRQAL